MHARSRASSQSKFIIKLLPCAAGLHTSEHKTAISPVLIQMLRSQNLSHSPPPRSILSLTQNKHTLNRIPRNLWWPRPLAGHAAVVRFPLRQHGGLSQVDRLWLTPILTQNNDNDQTVLVAMPFPASHFYQDTADFQACATCPFLTASSTLPHRTPSPPTHQSMSTSPVKYRTQQVTFITKPCKVQDTSGHCHREPL